MFVLILALLIVFAQAIMIALLVRFVRVFGEMSDAILKAHARNELLFQYLTAHYHREGISWPNPPQP